MQKINVLRVTKLLKVVVEHCLNFLEIIRKSYFRFQAIERAALEAESGQKKRKKLDCSIL